MKLNQNKIPGILYLLLKILYNRSLDEGYLGDIEEEYSIKADEEGNLSANLWLLFHFIKSIPGALIFTFYWSFIMFNNYLKTAFRNMQRDKGFAFINISGLAIGMACFILIMLFVRDELSYDKFHEKSDRIFRLVDTMDHAGVEYKTASSSVPYAPTLISEFPEIENAVRFISRRRLVEYDNFKDYENNVVYADASVFNVFTLPFISGDPNTALIGPGTVVISENVAMKYFHDNDPLNKILKVSGSDYRVTGVMKNIPRNSHFQADMFLSMKTLEQIPVMQERYFSNWVRHEFYTYILLREGYNADDIRKKLPDLIERHAADEIRNVLGGTMSTDLQPLTSIHLYSDLSYEISSNGDIGYVYIFASAAFFILLLACINFMNLSGAKSVQRSREVGLRKVVGAGRQQLIRQFIGESLLFAFIALCASMILIYIVLPEFNTLTGKDFSMGFIFEVNSFLIICGIFLIVGIVSGSYPALIASRAHPATIFKGMAGGGTFAPALRKFLVVLQFSITITLLVCTFIVLDQVDFLQNRKLGFDKEHVVVVPINNTNIQNNLESIKTELLANPNIISASASLGVPGGIAAGDGIDFITDEGKNRYTVRMYYTDHDFIKTLGMQIVEGRDFSKDIISDTKEAIIINETAAKMLNRDNPLDIQFIWGEGSEYEKRGRVIGVVKDFQFQSLKNEISPFVIHIVPTSTMSFAIRIRPEGIDRTLQFIKEKWIELDPVNPYEYYFLDEKFDRLYSSEEKMGTILRNFSVLAFSIAVLGLFGLVTFLIERRTKEIGIRKVLGSTVSGVVMLLSREFVKWIAIANVFAWPIAYFVMNWWLSDFAYRVAIGPEFFLLSGLAALLISFATIGLKALKAGRANPVDALRCE